jgi:DNA-binding NarL/FixJ family response regulator
LLMSQRRWGWSRTRKLLASIPVDESKSVGSMTDPQRYTIAALVASRKHRATPQAWDTAGVLTPTEASRQAKIAELFARGATESEIAGQLGLDERAVVATLRRIASEISY